MSRWSVCRRRRLASHASRMWRAESPPSFGHSLIGPNTFVASTTFSRRPPPEPVPDDRLGGPGALRSAVAVGGVEEVDAELDCAIHDHERVLLRSKLHEVHR